MKNYYVFDSNVTAAADLKMNNDSVKLFWNGFCHKEGFIDFVKGDKNGNTFVIDKPNDEICKKYQLSTFNFLGKECAHIIIFPYHKIEDIKCLIYDIKNDKIKINKIK